MTATVQALPAADAERRWTAIITYRHEHGPRPTYHHFEEAEELAAIIERGPDWNCILDVTLILNRRHHTMTVEQTQVA